MSQTNNNSLLITPTTQFNCGLDHGTNEFAIIGDDLVIESQSAVPDWFINIIGDTINGNLEDLYNNMYNYNYNLLQSLEQIEAAKNTYAQYISKVITDESAYVAALTTLNASIAESDATIRQLLSTYATRDFAVASAAQLLTAEINGGSIAAKIGSVETAMATQYGAMAQRLNQLSSEFDSQSALGNANAEAIETLTTYTGLGTVNGLPALIANSSFYRQLDAYLEGTNYGDVGGTSNLIQDVTAISTEAASSIEAKFEYGSTITLDGRSYKAGFGLVQTGTVSSDGTTYDSEFWVNASKFKVTNGVTGTTPFSIDSDGTVHLSGAVKIGGASDAPTYTSSTLAPSDAISSIDGSVHVQKRIGYTDVTWVRVNGEWVKSSGSDARSVSITASSQMFTVDSNTTTITPSIVTLTANTINFDSPVYVWTKNGTVLAGERSSSVRVPSREVSSTNSVSLAVTVTEATASNVVATDTFTLHKLSSGDDAITLVLTNENHTFTATTTGVITASDYIGKVGLYLGSTRVTSGVVYSKENEIGCKVSVDSLGVITVNSLTEASGSVTIKALYNGVTYSKILSLSKAIAGATGPAGVSVTGDRGALRTESYDIAGTISSGSSTISYRKTSVSGAWTQATVNTFIATVLPKSPYVIGDTIPYAAYVSTSDSTPRDGKEMICTAAGAPGTWQYNNKLVVSGDAIINGSLHASRITAGHIGSVMVSNGACEILGATTNIKGLDDPGGYLRATYPGYLWAHWNQFLNLVETGASSYNFSPSTRPVFHTWTGFEVDGHATGYFGYEFENGSSTLVGVPYMRDGFPPPSVVPRYYLNTHWRPFLSTYYTNSSDKAVNIAVLVMGRTGFGMSAPYSASGYDITHISYSGLLLGVKRGNNYSAAVDNGWTQAIQDTKAFSSNVITVGAGETIELFLVYVVGEYNNHVFNLGLSVTMTIIGVVT